MEPVTELYYKACLKFRLQPIKLPEIDGFKVIIDGVNFYFRAGQTPLNDCASAGVSSNKYSINKVLARANIPVPNSVAFTKEEHESGKTKYLNLHYPLVTKPTWDSACGKDVFCNIQNEHELHKHLDKMYETYPCMSIEEFKKNLNSYRILVLDGKVIGLVHRIAAHVVGNGRHTIEELIEIINKKRKRIKREYKIPLGPLKIMDETQIIFQELRIDKTYIPWEGESVPLRYICNSTYGGGMKALPLEQLHPDNATLACQAAQVLNLRLVGFDVLCHNISESIHETEGYFLEANYNPDLTIHENTIFGEKTRVSHMIIKNFLENPTCGHQPNNLISKLLSPATVVTGFIGTALLFLGMYLYD